MKKMNMGLWLSASMTVVFALVSCGTLDGGTDAGSGSGCKADADCATGTMCHPVSKQCVATCTGSTDCPSSMKTCAPLKGSAKSFCQCSTDAICASAAAGNVCQGETLQCAAKCTSKSDCAGTMTCDTASGQCKAAAAVDAGTPDAGTVACSTDTQPNSCGYGNYCAGDLNCYAAEDGTCSAITSAISNGRAPFTAASTGPVIFLVTDEAIDDATKCTAAAPVPYTVTVYAYAGGSLGSFPSQKTGLPGFWYYNSSGAKTDIAAALLQQSNYATQNGGTMMSAKFTVCSTQSAGITGGFGFTNGNGYCSAQTHTP